ncbi:YoaK family protein [Mycobacterium sp.]|uniref:YoaK family protein n=1 Tax=Mycobacterium sp. TaxID=1785 RepID=UPI0025E95595|nr:YoaK family protein [Mycobacterium sp.]
MQPINDSTDRREPARGIVLGASTVLALTAGWVNAVALLIFALPVGNLTAVTTQLGMKTANPWLYEGHVLLAVLTGFFMGALTAGVVLPAEPIMAGIRPAAVLVGEAVLLLMATAAVEDTFVRDILEGTSVETQAVQALFAASALGLQNGLTSSFREMAVRTTHFTGTVTDLGLMIGRSRIRKIDPWKASTLALTLLLFLIGGAAGLVAGSRWGGYALIAPAMFCVALAAASVLWVEVGRSVVGLGARREPVKA